MKTRAQGVENCSYNRYADIGLTPSEPFEPSRDLLEKLHAYATRARMRILCFDFAVDENGQLIFLEANPDGQWIWLDKTGELLDAFTRWAVEMVNGGGDRCLARSQD